MSNIEVGEYCRDINGEILQVENVWLDDDRIGIKFKEYAGSNTFSKEDLKRFKHSFDIIDLIEVGDYVNKYLVVAKSDDGYVEIAIGDDAEQGELLEQSDIKSIVTKEQFKEKEYIIDE